MNIKELYKQNLEAEKIDLEYRNNFPKEHNVESNYGTWSKELQTKYSKGYQEISKNYIATYNKLADALGNKIYKLDNGKYLHHCDEFGFMELEVIDDN